MSPVAALSKLVSSDSPKKIVFTSRGSSAIRVALRAAARMGRKRVLIPDQGGWLTYEKDVRRAGLIPVVLKTRDGIFSPEDLKACSFDSVLLNSMPGYFAVLPMKEIFRFCVNKGILLINDVSGSVGRSAALYGDIAVGSFGRWKPLSVSSEKGASGGFLAFSPALDASLFESSFSPPPDFFSLAGNALSLLPGRLSFWSSLRKKVLGDLLSLGLRLIHPHADGINVLVAFSGNAEKERVVSFCSERGLPFVLCPAATRVLRDAVSIEIKRISPDTNLEFTSGVTMK